MKSTSTEKNTSIFVTGISTDVGKTIVSAVLVEALHADYWKPIQSGDLENSDTLKVQRWISNSKSEFHKNAYALKTPVSPHLSAQLENKEIVLAEILRPTCKNRLVIEGAGGVFVPLNSQNTMIDLIHPTDKVVVVSRNYLGSINHTLLTIEALKLRNVTIAGIIFSGEENPSTEEWLTTYSGVPIIGRINQEPFFDASVIKKYAEKYRQKWNELF